MHTVLVVEDNDDQWYLTRWALLRTWPGARCVRAATDADTWRYLAACLSAGYPLPELILLDLQLPRWDDGRALMERLKRHHTFRRVPLVILSYCDNAADSQQAQASFSLPYLAKSATHFRWRGYFENFCRFWLREVMRPRA